MKQLVYLFFLTPFFYACSPKIGSSIVSKQVPLPDTTFVVVLQQDEDFNNDGIEVGTIKSGDNGLSVNCSYLDVIDNLKQLARQNGANIIKITKHKTPDHWSTCDRLTAKIYKVPDFRKHEKQIEWVATRRLIWEDFKGTPKATLTNVAAQTHCGFGLESIQVSLFSKPKLSVTTTFTCNLSWVDPQQKYRSALLEHEQGHFDLCEVYARQLRKKLQERKLTAFNINNEANVVFNAIYALYVERQEVYEQETSYGLDRQKQMEWTEKIKNELIALNDFSK